MGFELEPRVAVVQYQQVRYDAMFDKRRIAAAADRAVRSLLSSVNVMRKQFTNIIAVGHNYLFHCSTRAISGRRV